MVNFITVSSVKRPQSQDQLNFSSIKDLIKPIQMSPVYNLNRNDVLGGKGKGVQAYPGNIQFRNFINQRRDEYIVLKKNKDKNDLALQIMNEVTSLDPPGRFLVEDPSGAMFHELGRDKVLAKIKQALREKREVKLSMNKQQSKSVASRTNLQQTKEGNKPGNQNDGSGTDTRQRKSGNESGSNSKVAHGSASSTQNNYTKQDFQKMVDMLKAPSPKSSKK